MLANSLYKFHYFGCENKHLASIQYAIVLWECENENGMALIVLLNMLLFYEVSLIENEWK